MASTDNERFLTVVARRRQAVLFGGYRLLGSLRRRVEHLSMVVLALHLRVSFHKVMHQGVICVLTLAPTLIGNDTA